MSYPVCGVCGETFWPVVDEIDRCGCDKCGCDKREPPKPPRDEWPTFEDALRLAGLEPKR